MRCFTAGLAWHARGLPPAPAADLQPAALCAGSRLRLVCLVFLTAIVPMLIVGLRQAPARQLPLFPPHLAPKCSLQLTSGRALPLCSPACLDPTTARGTVWCTTLPCRKAGSPARRAAGGGRWKGRGTNSHRLTIWSAADTACHPWPPFELSEAMALPPCCAWAQLATGKGLLCFGSRKWHYRFAKSAAESRCAALVPARLPPADGQPGRAGAGAALHAQQARV